MCESRIFEIEKKYLDLNVDFSVFNFKNFQITVFALHGGTQTTQSIRIIMVASASMNKLVNKNMSLSCHLPMVERVLT
jgi:hypothetical protein